MKLINLVAGAALAAGVVSGSLAAAGLQHGTLEAWKEYVRSADLRMQERLDGGQPFLWVDESPARKMRVQRGEVVVAPFDGRGTHNVPDGLIHDWIGAVFIPGATIESLLRVVHDYDRYKDIYKPVVTDSKTLACSAGRQEFSMIWQRHVLFVNAAVQGKYEAHDVMLDSRRGYSIADATQVREFEDYGHSGEHLLPPDTGDGFIWRMRSVARYEERDGGLYLELEAMALTRDIPASLRWLATPVVNHLSVNSLTSTLRETRDAVATLPPGTDTLALCSERLQSAHAAHAAHAGGEK